MGQVTVTPNAIGVAVYAALASSYSAVMVVKGVSGVPWLFAETLIAVGAGWFGFWRLSRGAGVIKTALLVSLIHVGVRLAPLALGSLFDPHVPAGLVGLVLVCALLLACGCFLLARYVAVLVARRAQ